MSQKKKNVKIPTKSELIQLQKLYKTDEKIGERLGGVPAYLVAYWRRKKNVPKHSQPKFSEKEIKTLWERFGDDDKCGMELGISKAAFYNWRRRYGIKEKPAFLKLEQLEFNFPGMRVNTGSGSLYNKQTIIQKIISAFSESETIEVGSEVDVEPALTMMDIAAREVIEEFRKSDTELVWNPNKVFISLSECTNSAFENQPETYKLIKDFVKRQGIKNFFDISEGNCHQVALENGMVLPGRVILGTNKYITSTGTVCSLGMPQEAAEIARVWSTGKFKMKTPATIRIDISGRRSRGVYGKDITLLVLKQLKGVNIEGKVVEFYGNVISQMSISERFTLCNMTYDAGAAGALCPFDSVTRRFLNGRTQANYAPLVADKNAEYEEMYQINIDQLVPQIAIPGNSDSIRPVSELEGTPLNMIFIGTTVNGRFDDLRVTAEILKGKKVAPNCRVIIYPSSRSVYLEALKKGLIRMMVEAGAVLIHPGYWPDRNTVSLLEQGDRALVTCNYSLINSIDPEKNESLICSPATAAASALNGAITDPARYVK